MLAWIKGVWLAVYLYFAGKSIDWAGLLDLAEDTITVLRDPLATVADKYAAMLKFLEALKPVMPVAPIASPLRADGATTPRLGAAETAHTPEIALAAIRQHISENLMSASPVKFDGSIILALIRLVQLMLPLIKAVL